MNNIEVDLVNRGRDKRSMIHIGLPASAVYPSLSSLA